MQKNLLVFFIVILMSNVISFVKADGEIKKLCTIGAIAGLSYGGHYLQQLNDEYSKKNKKPDARMRYSKMAIAAGSILAADILTGDTSSTEQHLAKVAVAGVAMFATSQPVADILRPLPLIGGLLTDPIDEDGDERKDIGATARFALTYIPLRAVAVKMFPSIASKK